MFAGSGAYDGVAQPIRPRPLDERGLGLPRGRDLADRIHELASALSSELDPRRSSLTLQFVNSTSATSGPSLQLRRSAAALARDDGRMGWAPIVAALAIDLADFAMVGPIGVVFGLFVGGLLTTIVALASGARLRRALGLGVLGGIYCAMPVTDAIPLATMLTLIHGFLLRKRSTPEGRPPEPLTITPLAGDGRPA